MTALAAERPLQDGIFNAQYFGCLCLASHHYTYLKFIPANVGEHFINDHPTVIDL